MTRKTNSYNNVQLGFIVFLNIYQVFLKICSYNPHSKNSIFFHRTRGQLRDLHPFQFHIQDQPALKCSNILFLFILVSI